MSKGRTEEGWKEVEERSVACNSTRVRKENTIIHK